VEHAFGAGVEVSVQKRPVRGKADFAHGETLERLAGVVLGDGGGLAGDDGEFDGADELLMVVRMNPACSNGIKTPKKAVEGSGAAVAEGGEAGADLGVARGSGREAVEESAEVEAGTADQDRDSIAAGDSG